MRSRFSKYFVILICGLLTTLCNSSSDCNQNESCNFATGECKSIFPGSEVKSQFKIFVAQAEPMETDLPTDVPTDTPTDVPTDVPADAPTDALTDAPTDPPTDAPTDTPTPSPTATATASPTATATVSPTATTSPSPQLCNLTMPSNMINADGFDEGCLTGTDCTTSPQRCVVDPTNTMTCKCMKPCTQPGIPSCNDGYCRIAGGETVGQIEVPIMVHMCVQRPGGNCGCQDMCSNIDPNSTNVTVPDDMAACKDLGICGGVDAPIPNQVCDYVDIAPDLMFGDVFDACRCREKIVDCAMLPLQMCTGNTENCCRHELTEGNFKCICRCKTIPPVIIFGIPLGNPTCECKKLNDALQITDVNCPGGQQAAD